LSRARYRNGPWFPNDRVGVDHAPVRTQALLFKQIEVKHVLDQESIEVVVDQTRRADCCVLVVNSSSTSRVTKPTSVARDCGYRGHRRYLGLADSSGFGELINCRLSLRR